ncbi:hypothetical protein [Amycolatopsis plumensis]
MGLPNGTSVAEVESFIALGIQDRILANSQSYRVPRRWWRRSRRCRVAG